MNVDITDLERFLDSLSKQLPSLKYLSILGNPACPDQLSCTDTSDEDYEQYRYSESLCPPWHRGVLVNCSRLDVFNRLEIATSVFCMLLSLVSGGFQCYGSATYCIVFMNIYIYIYITVGCDYNCDWQRNWKLNNSVKTFYIQ